MRQAYLDFGPTGYPTRTVAVEHRETETPLSGRTQSGYGPRLTTPYMVKWAGRWRRVYAACYGNAASHYIGKPGAWLATFHLH